MQMACHKDHLTGKAVPESHLETQMLHGLNFHDIVIHTILLQGNYLLGLLLVPAELPILP